MSLLATVLSLVLDAALGGWLGAMAFFSFVGAPTAFRALDEADAGTYVNATFPTYYRVGVAAGVVSLLAAAALAGLAGVDAALLATLAASLVGTGIFAYSAWVLVPAMEAAGEDAFERYHRRSVVLNGLAMGAVALGLVGAHL